MLKIDGLLLFTLYLIAVIRRECVRFGEIDMVWFSKMKDGQQIVGEAILSLTLNVQPRT